MRQPLDTKKLQKLCESVVRNCSSLNGDGLPIAKDHSWAELTHDTLPKLKEYLESI